MEESGKKWIDKKITRRDFLKKAGMTGAGAVVGASALGGFFANKAENNRAIADGEEKITGEEEIYSHTDLYDFKANIEGAEEIFKIFKPLIEKKDNKLASDLTEKFATINSLLDKYKTDDKHYKLYTDLTKENTKELSEAVTKLGEPLSQMGVILDEEAK